MSSVYESIMAGLSEAIADAENGVTGLKRHTVELPETALQTSVFPHVGERPEVFSTPSVISPVSV